MVLPVQQGQRPGLADFPHVQHPLLRQFLSYYLDLRQGQPVPRRQQLSPLDIPQLLGNVFLYEFDRATQDFQIRLAGSLVAEKVDTIKAGSRLSDVFPPVAVPVVLQRYRRICVERMVMHNIGQVFHLLGGAGLGERIAMPLLGDDGARDFLIGATVYPLPKPDMKPAVDAPPVSITYTALVP